MHSFLAYFIHRKFQKIRTTPKKSQEKVLRKIIKKLSRTQWGKEKDLNRDDTIREFQRKTPIYTYEKYEKEVLPLLEGSQKPNILWPGRLKYFCISSGTTSGEKKIPVYRQQIISYILSGIYSAYLFIYETKQYDLFKGKIFQLYGAATLKKMNNHYYTYIGYLLNSTVPHFLMKSKYPSKEIATTSPWQEKIKKIVSDIDSHKINVLIGTPPWVNNLLELYKEEKKQVFSAAHPELKLFIYGGCSFEKYEKKFSSLFGSTNKLYLQETYPATEGLMAFQDTWDLENPFTRKPMLLNVGANIFFEFLEFKDSKVNHSKRYWVDDVEIGKTYSLLITAIGGMVSFLIGDNVKIISKTPFRVIFAGRSKQNINLVNEHMDYNTLELIFNDLNQKYSNCFLDYVILPKVIDGYAQYHWYLSTQSQTEITSDELIESINHYSKSRNPFYKKWSEAGILKTETIRLVPEKTFLEFLKTKKSVGQNKVPHVISEVNAQKDFENFLKTIPIF